MRTQMIWLTAAALLLAGVAARGQEPALPAGLPDSSSDKPQSSDGPALPEGLDGGDSDGGPALPSGLEAAETQPSTRPADETDDTAQPDKTDYLQSLKDLGLRGFWEVRGGVRTQNDPHEHRDATIGETRLQLDWQQTIEQVTVKFTGDLVYDQAYNHLSNVNLYTGSGWFDLRKAWARFTPLEFMDVKVGRQVLTWGTGNLLFLNDRFPKDWGSFFIGRDLEYLKAPSDAIKLSLFSDLANVDLVYIPRFMPSRGITGRRLSYYSPLLGRRAGEDAIVSPHTPNEWFDDAEYATRIYRRLGSYELAAYGHWGFWGTPEGYDPARRQAFYPRLNSYGGSIRGPFWRGIGNFEGVYYDSSQDRQGDEPFIPNSEVRLLAGYEMDLPEIASDLTVGVQYYVEMMMDYDAYRDALIPGIPARDRCRHVMTFEVTKLLMNQNLRLNFFAYYSPTDDDAYLRPNVQYDIDDHWTVELGGNVFFGQRDYTFFGQFERNSNIYTALRYGF